MLSAVERLWNRVQKTDSCWLWTGTKIPKGYGTFNVAGKTTYTHRYSYELAFGAIPPGAFVLHHCDRPACVRPSHLFLGTPADNTLDMVLKNRHTKSCKLTAADVRTIRQQYATGHILQETLARQYGVAQTTISYALRSGWKHVA